MQCTKCILETSKHIEILGPWQWKVILITGIFTIPISSHVLVMTFMNAEVNSLHLLIKS